MSLRPKGRTAVMADRAPLEVEGDDDRTALLRKLEFFPTPPWAARAGGELIQRVDPGMRSIWEPACGEGHMVAGLATYCRQIVCSDIHAHDVSRVSTHWLGQFDFVSDEPHRFDGGVDWIATNPPFRLAAEFVRRGLQRARRGVAILARASWFESAGRYPLFFGETPLTAYAPFFGRVAMQLGGWDPGGSTATAYAWFLWLKPEHQADGPPPPIVIPIPPTAREVLTRAHDARLFGRTEPMPLIWGPQ